MKYICNQFRLGAVAAAIALALPFNALADSIDDAAGDAGYDALKSQVEMLQRQLQQIQETLKQYEQQTVTQEDIQEVRQEVAAVSTQQSEWKNTDSVVHLAGYGDVTYSDGQGKDTSGAFSGVRFNPIFHYQWKDLIMLESELEFEIEDDGDTEVALEYLTVDLLVNDYLTLLGGKFLSPVGQFRQNLHPSWINKLPTAPPGFGHDQAAPNAEVGIQARGGFPIGNPMFANYALYLGNGPVLELEGDEIEEINSGGRTSNDDNKLVYGGRFGLIPIPMLEIGLSAAMGKVAGDEEPSARRDYDVYGADLAWKWRNLGLRGEYIKQKVGSEVTSDAPESATWKSWYAQAAYRFMPSKWESVLRYTDYDTPHDSEDQKQWALGLNYYFAPNAQAKAAYNFNDGKRGEDSDDDRFQLQFAYGF